ncbi:MAG: acetolactate decarboxylase [Saprospiraceae bacterium]|nr:acetolactate decarboxylase [Saprospiraceae bacterium]
MRYLMLCISYFLAFTSSCQSQKVERDLIYQVSTLDALMDGQYTGTVPYGRLHRYGNFGVGTFDHLDGEMIGLNGQFYQVKSDGRAYRVKGPMKTPFANITSFKADWRESLKDSINYQELTEHLLSKLPDPDKFYAIKIEGRFRHIKTRSVPRQQEPYPHLTEVIANQIVFEYEDIEGTMVGFHMPETVQGISTPGFHFHFISKDKSRGGHLLDCTTDRLKISIDYSDKLQILNEKEKDPALTHPADKRKTRSVKASKK